MVNDPESQPEDGKAAARVAEETREITTDNTKHHHPHQGSGGRRWRRALGMA